MGACQVNSCCAKDGEIVVKDHYKSELDCDVADNDE